MSDIIQVLLVVGFISATLGILTSLTSPKQTLLMQILQILGTFAVFAGAYLIWDALGLFNWLEILTTDPQWWYLLILLVPGLSAPVIFRILTTSKPEEPPQ